MTEYQTHAALVATLETEIVRLRAVNAELRKSIQAPVQPDTKLEQAARQALEALAGMLAIVDDSQAVAGYHLNGELEPWGGFPEVEAARAAITALREALEAALQPAAVEQEPVAGVVIDGSLYVPALVKIGTEDAHIAKFGGSRLYTAPQPARQPLTDDWIRGMCKESWVFDAAKQWIRIAERAHGIGGEA